MKAWRTLLVLMFGLCAACSRSDMDSQPKYNEYKPGSLFANGQSLQHPPPGSTSREDRAYDEEKQKPALTAELIARGRSELDIFCAPCHDRTGSGHGMIVQRGMPAPPSFHEPRLRQAPDQHFFEVISNGYGAMYSYADRVAPRDRWAIVAYIRALQLSQSASLTDVPPDQQSKLGTGAP